MKKALSTVSRIIVLAALLKVPETQAQSWTNLGSGMNSSVEALAFDASGNLYAGGLFTSAGGVAANRIAKWDGSSWSSLGSGMNRQVWALGFDASGNLYAGGDFTDAGSVAANRVAKWNGTSWSNLGSGMDDLVKGLAFDASGNLYAGGYFTNAGGVEANEVARWNGTFWTNLGSGMSYNWMAGVDALAFNANGNLYVGGVFTNAGGVEANEVARWNGTFWTNLGSGMPYGPMGGGVYCLGFDASGNLYAGGGFTIAGGIAASRVARWNGTFWTNLGSGVSGALFGAQVFDLGFDASGNLYAGGTFTNAGGVAANHIAKWVIPDTMSASIALLSGFGELYVNNTIRFSADVSGALGSVSYQWDLDGDDSYDDATGQEVSWQYSTEGTRLVKVRADDGYQTALANMFITIGKPPVDNEQPTPPIPNVPGSARDALNGTNAFSPDVNRKNNGLIIIAHGMNASATSDWVAATVQAITNKLGSSTPNIMAWDWEDLAVVNSDNATIELPRLRSRGSRQGGLVAQWITDNITANNINSRKPIHIIGHSAGGFVGGGCVVAIPHRINQVSLLDTPFYPAGIINTYLHDNTDGNADFYITQYGTMPNTNNYSRYVRRHQLHAYDLPETLPTQYLDHAGVHKWYREQTIAGTEQEGFWYSPWTGNDFPFRLREMIQNLAGTWQPTMIELSDFSTFGQVTASGGKYILTEGTGNAGIFKTVAFPVGAQSMFFEYSFTAPGDGDYLGVFVGTNDTIFEGDDLPIARSGYLVGEGYVADYAGQTSQLIFKLHSVSNKNAQVTIKSIRISTEDDLSASTPGPAIEANGKADSLTVGTSDSVTIAVAFDVGSYPTDVSVDWWLIASANLSSWYYLNNSLALKEAAFSGNNYTVFHPVYQGPLVDLPSTTEVLDINFLPAGMYYFWFAIDYPADGILDPNGAILYDQVIVTVQ